jgi:hypothetical protein
MLSQTSPAAGDAAAAKDHLDESLELAWEIGDLANLAYLVEALAVLEHPASESHARRAAVLLGAAEALRNTAGATVYSYYQPDTARREAVTTAARDLLGEAAWDDAVERGRALSWRAGCRGGPG